MMRRRAVVTMLAMGLAACTAARGDRDAAHATAVAAPVPSPAPPPSPPPAAVAPAAQDGPFSGHWQACAPGESPDACNRYVLIQRGDRICGTWSYFASGDGYEGRVVAQAASVTEARRMRVCGRPGSEAKTECEAGWDTVDKPLRLCDGKLGDLDGQPGRCHADYERVDDAGKQLAALERQPWVQACLNAPQPEAMP